MVRDKEYHRSIRENSQGVGMEYFSQDSKILQVNRDMVPFTNR